MDRVGVSKAGKSENRAEKEWGSLRGQGRRGRRDGGENYGRARKRGKYKATT
jgi:hypothetical protein